MVESPKAKFVRAYTTSGNRFMVLSVASQVSPLTQSMQRFLPVLTVATLLFGMAHRTEAQPAPVPEIPTQNPALQDPTLPDPAANQDLRPLAQGVLSIQGGKQLMDEAGSAVSTQNYELAVNKLQQARQVFNQLSNFYQDLGGSFAGIDTRIAEVQRKQAFETAQMRDEATYQLALVHRAQNQPELAVPLLVQIVRSQNPTRDLGKKAYQQLFELGFVDAPFPRQDAPAAGSPR
jgi:small-conductance mechanosensitive channel